MTTTITMPISGFERCNYLNY